MLYCVMIQYKDYLVESYLIDEKFSWTYIRQSCFAYYTYFMFKSDIENKTTHILIIQTIEKYVISFTQHHYASGGLVAGATIFKTGQVLGHTFLDLSD